ncbi:uncharacterized protein Osi6 [Venturia canescens]|uniref:uncharacterized protein Osi6 n=1 Tax=Venturia canescens TaxID=32260 RepID=UPI001C9D6492|nr:uncharacterized protein LOC122405960 [Venturia canescens]
MNPQLSIVFLTVALVFVNAQSIDDCLQQDSISCVQRSLYRKAKEFFDKDSLELVSGVSLVQSANGGERSARTSKKLVYDQEIAAASDVAERQNVLENFIGDEAGNFLTGRSLRINFAPAITKIGESARAMVDSVPEEVKQAVDEVVEGRGKKKLMKAIMPLLALAKVKIGILSTIGYFVIGLLAKKAIFASLISLAISAFIGLKALWEKKSHGLDVTGYNAGGWSSGGSGGWAPPPTTGGWSSGGSAGWDDHSSFGAHSQAFSGYHH